MGGCISHIEFLEVFYETTIMCSAVYIQTSYSALSS